MKETGGYWIYKIIDGVVARRRPTAQEIIEAEKASVSRNSVPCHLSHEAKKDTEK